MNEKLLTTAMVAKRLNCRTARIREKISSGEIRAIDLNKGKGRPEYRIEEKALLEYLNSSRVDA